MKKNLFLFIALAGALLAHEGLAQERQKLAQTGMKFLSVVTDARVGSMGNAVAALDYNAAAMFFNPAGMARLNSFASVSLGSMNWIADIKYVYGSAAFRPRDGAWGVFGVSVRSVDYGEFRSTIRDNNPANELGYFDNGTFSPTAMAIGLGYGKALSDKFSVGGQVKYVVQDLGSAVVGYDASDNLVMRGYETNVLAFDFGILYRTGFKSLNFGMYVENFSKEVTFEEEGFQLPLQFKIGVVMNLADVLPMNRDTHAFLLAVDAAHPRDYPEQLNIGGEYVLANTFALRGGYSFPNDEHGVSFGAGFKKSLKSYGLALDYAYTPFGLFDNVQRFSLHFSF
jgi:hypothetical protein